mmetsp:Transcript_11198/g.21325  ORF Transcript_11198/g.21325 Transcript_11198/m.21325 type:complete len:190 (-) Transcript_11198:945-1514(-)
MATVVQVGSTNAVHPSTGRKLSQEPALSFDLFPAALHPTLREIDDEGNGVLEIDELTEIFEKYADMKRAQKSGAIAVSSFSPDVQKTLKVFDSSGDGLIEPSELQRAAELYADSRLMVSRLIKLSVALLIFMGVMLGCIAGLTITVCALPLVCMSTFVQIFLKRNVIFADCWMVICLILGTAVLSRPKP